MKKLDRKIGELQKIAPKLWVMNGLMTIPKGLFPFPIPKIFGQAGVRMTIVELSEGGLLIHSPIKLDSKMRALLAQVGPVKIIVAPNVMHNTFILDYQKVFPQAQVWVAPKTKKRHPRLSKFLELSDQRPIAPKDLDQRCLLGHSMREVFFLHRDSKTLIVTDLACNVGPEVGFLEKLYCIYYQAYGKFALPSYHRKAVYDSEKFSQNINQVLEWDFDRIVMSHGNILETGGKKAMQKIWSWAL